MNFLGLHRLFTNTTTRKKHDILRLDNVTKKWDWEKRHYMH